MKVYEELTLKDFETWSGATTTKNRIIEEGKEQEFEDLIEELYPEGLSATELNDLLWFDDSILKYIGIEEEEE